jgi:RNA polymerase sigma factor (sigma-70 family)
MIGPLIEQVFRRERARILASIARKTRDLDLAEEALQDACMKATVVWPTEGIPENPGAWLTTVATRRAIDLGRGRKRVAEGDGDRDRALEGSIDMSDEPAAGTPRDRENRLALLFACCSAGIPERARASLALRAFLGLSTREIARAFLEPEATTAQRIVRAKKELAAMPNAYDVPPEGPLRTAALAPVLGTLYLLFNEGYLALEAVDAVRVQLCEDAMNLTQTVVELERRARSRAASSR